MNFLLRLWQLIDRKPKRKAVTHIYRTCKICEREIAVTRDGRLFLHRCERKAVANE